MEYSTLFLTIVASFVGGILVLYFIPFGLWFSALLSGVKISLLRLIFMRLRKVSPREIVSGLLVASKGGIVINTDYLEAHYLAGGDVKNVVCGLVAAKNAGLNLTFKKACASDLKGINLVEVVNKTNEIKKKDEYFA